MQHEHFIFKSRDQWHNKCTFCNRAGSGGWGRASHHMRHVTCRGTRGRHATTTKLQKNVSNWLQISVSEVRERTDELGQFGRPELVSGTFLGCRPQKKKKINFNGTHVRQWLISDTQLTKSWARFQPWHWKNNSGLNATGNFREPFGVWTRLGQWARKATREQFYTNSMERRKALGGHRCYISNPTRISDVEIDRTNKMIQLILSPRPVNLG